MDGVLERLAAEARDAAARLTAWRRTCANPVFHTILGLAAASALAFTSSMVTIVLFPFSLLLLLAAACKAGKPDKRLLHALVYPLAVSAVAAAPLLLSNRVGDASLLVFRVVAPAVFMALLVWSVGWMSLVEGLGRLGVPRQLTESLALLSFLVPRFAGQMLALLAARRARHLGSPGYREWWRLQATALGELLIRAMDSAHRLALAIEARTLASGNGAWGERSGCGARTGGGHPWLIYAASLLVIAASVAGYALGY
ncbi:cobalt transport protein [Pyrolobus fumarii 1A]|uniref:Cobalt transport protein n=1 Tax=Pyrolobus fumarii (strain DSM 11204 / 1A) TaxID=694429 RepID=G0EHE4_PYRF1|nr:cobalt transporter [Pyrolobus fumarii]AEM38519.1 cobalt transport protein [Pyrolobus fumarii 1A]